MFDAIFIKPLANILFIIYGLIPGHDFGLAVILLTAIIRFALWPVLARQLHSQKKMQALQPEIAKLREQAKGDKQKESALLMELYREKEINPLASCLPLLIQLPFLIGLFAVFTQATSGIANFEQYLYGWTKDLPHIANIIADPNLYKTTLFGVIDLAAKSNIILAVLAGASQFIQVRQITPKHTDPNDPSASANKMMMWMFPVLTGWIGYTLVAALPLYWAVSNGISILQQTITMRDEVEKMEEAEVVTKVRTASDESKPKKVAKNSKRKKRG